MNPERSNTLKLLWPGFNEKGSLIIPLEWSEVPFPQNPIYIEREQFEPKDELHVTVIGKKAGSVIQEKMLLDPRIESTLRQVFEGIDWSFELGEVVHLLSREKERPGQGATVLEKTVLVRLRIPGMAIFYEGLKSIKLVTEDTIVPPSHVTLYTLNCPSGIGVPSDDALEDLTERVLPIDNF